MILMGLAGKTSVIKQDFNIFSVGIFYGSSSTFTYMFYEKKTRFKTTMSEKFIDLKVKC